MPNSETQECPTPADPWSAQAEYPGAQLRSILGVPNPRVGADVQSEYLSFSSCFSLSRALSLSLSLYLCLFRSNCLFSSSLHFLLPFPSLLSSYLLLLVFFVHSLFAFARALSLSLSLSLSLALFVFSSSALSLSPFVFFLCLSFCLSLSLSLAFFRLRLIGILDRRRRCPTHPDLPTALH